MSRIEGLAPDRQTPEQRELYDAILGGRRGQAVAAAGSGPGRAGSGLLDASGALVGPFNAWLLSPAIGDRIQRLGEAIRFGSLAAAERARGGDPGRGERVARRVRVVGARAPGAPRRCRRRGDRRDPGGARARLLRSGRGDRVAVQPRAPDPPARERRDLSRRARALRRERRDGADHPARLLHAGVDDAQRLRGAAARRPGAGVRRHRVRRQRRPAPESTARSTRCDS